MSQQSMKEYLTALITEKGRSINDDIVIDGHFGLEWHTLVDFIDKAPEYHEDIRTMLVKIDFANGDVFHYLTHLAKGMLKSWGHEVNE